MGSMTQLRPPFNERLNSAIAGWHDLCREPVIVEKHEN